MPLRKPAQSVSWLEKDFHEVCKKWKKKALGISCTICHYPPYVTRASRLSFTRVPGRRRKSLKSLFLSPPCLFIFCTRLNFYPGFCQFRNFPLEDGLRLWTLGIFAISIFWRGECTDGQGVAANVVTMPKPDDGVHRVRMAEISLNLLTHVFLWRRH